MVRTLVLREFEDGKRDDGLWLQGDAKGLLLKQIRGAVAKDNTGVRSGHASLAEFLAAKAITAGKK